MSRRKPAIASKHTPSPRIAAKAQRASQAIVRSPKHSGSRSVGAGSTEPSPEPHNNLEQDALLAEHGEALIKNPEVTVQNDPKQMMEGVSKTEVDFLSSASANVRAYQAKLLE